TGFNKRSLLGVKVEHRVINMPVKGSLGGTRMYPTMDFHPEYNITRYFVDKIGDRSGYSQEEKDRQRKHDPYYGFYKWYYPQFQHSNSDSEFDAFISQRVAGQNSR
ncbi:hypothetical protein, partial [Xenorhabdus griffiniae]